MNKKLLPQLEVLAFDLDHCLVSHTWHSNSNQIINDIWAEELAKDKVFSGWTLKDVKTEMNTLYLSYGSHFLEHLKTKHSVDIEELFKKVHQVVLDVSHTEICDKTRRGLESFDGTLAVITHGSKFYAETWLDRLGVRDLIRPDLIIGLDCLGLDTFPLKTKEHPDPFHELERRTGIPLNLSGFVDDSLKNLKTAKSLEMYTVWTPLAKQESEEGTNEIHTSVVNFFQHHGVID